jgi:DNA-binding response OmpR family regulator
MGELINPSDVASSRDIQSTVLVVDDDARLLAVTAEMLRAEGYRVLKARTPEEAELVFEQRPAEIDLLLSDVQMPGMSGPELGTRLRRVRPDLPVIFMTGHPGQIAALGKVLEKPFGMDDLCGRVAAALGGPAPLGMDRSWLDRMRR